MTASIKERNLIEANPADSLSAPVANFSVLEREIDSRGWNQLSYSDRSRIFIVKILRKKNV